MPDLARALEVERRGFDVDGLAPSRLSPWKPHVSADAYTDTPRLCAERRRDMNLEMEGRDGRPRKRTA